MVILPLGGNDWRPCINSVVLASTAAVLPAAHARADTLVAPARTARVPMAAAPCSPAPLRPHPSVWGVVQSLEAATSRTWSKRATRPQTSRTSSPAPPARTTATCAWDPTTGARGGRAHPLAMAALTPARSRWPRRPSCALGVAMLLKPWRNKEWGKNLLTLDIVGDRF
jgi:hypothetical protein